MKLLKAIAILLAVLTLASCTININYPGSSIAEYVTAKEKSTEAPDESVEATEEIPETEAPETGNEETLLHVTSLTSPISKNKTARLDAVGKPNTTYSIDVYYTTGRSDAKGLETKSANELGQVSWSWKIGASLKPGRYKIVIAGGGESIEQEIEIE